MNDMCEWHVLSGKFLSSGHVAEVFAREMLNAEWKRYDLKFAEALGKCLVEVRLGDGPISTFQLSPVKLVLDVSVKPAQADQVGGA